jgi:molecular chaperone HscB
MRGVRPAFPLSPMIDFSRNHFDLLGLPACFRIDAAALERAYRALQSDVHPDRHVGGTDAEKRLALQASARVNEAYRALQDPVARAEYLLHLRGVDVRTETDNALPVAFLTQQLERREDAEEAADAQDEPRLAALVDAVRADAAGLQTEVEAALDAGDLERGRRRVRELRFLTHLIEDLDEMRAAVLDR